MTKLPETNRTDIPEDQIAVYRTLLDSVTMMASSYDKLKKKLPAFVYAPDDVAVSFRTDVKTFAPQLTRYNIISPEISERLNAIVRKLDSLNPEVDSDWSVDAFCTHPIWVEMRKDAGEILRALGERVPIP